MNNSTPNSQPTPTLKLEIRGLGVPPNFKNSKQIIPGKAVKDLQPDGTTIVKQGRPILVTSNDHKRWMQKAGDAFEYQLLSAFRTGDGTISTDALRRFLMSSLPYDDALNFVPELNVRVEFVGKGEEGADVTIEPAPSPFPSEPVAPPSQQQQLL